MYLHYTYAYHKPYHTKGPFSPFLRIRRICFTNDDFLHHGIKMIEHYPKRGYPFKSLRKHMFRACKFTQDELLQVKTKSPIDTPVVVTTYNPENPGTKEFIHNWNIIEHSNNCGSTFQHKQLI